MKTPLNIKIQRIIPRDEFKSFVEKKKQLESVHHPCIYPGPRFKQVRHKSATSLNYYPSVSLSPFILNNQLSFPRHWVNGAKSFFVQEARGFERSSQHGNTFYPLSLSLYRFLFADLRKVGVVSRFIPFIADNFVRLASPATVSKSNDHFILRIYHTGRRGGEQVRRSLIAAIFPAIVPSSPFPSLDRKPLNPVDRSNRERGRVIFASTCCNFTKFHHRISRFICIPSSFFSWILIGFYFVNSSFLFFFEEEEKRKREFRKFDESWCKIDIQWFCVFRFLPFSPLIIDF